jgi:hypothetical protein
MASFVNVLGSDLWSEADIVNRTESMIASYFPPNTTAILNRKVIGAATGRYTLSADEQAELDHYNTVCLAASAAGNAARADMARLQSALDYEHALAIAIVDRSFFEQVIIDNASADTLALVAERTPAPERQP